MEMQRVEGGKMQLPKGQLGVVTRDTAPIGFQEFWAFKHNLVEVPSHE
jgi:hypothetical protein